MSQIFKMAERWWPPDDPLYDQLETTLHLHKLNSLEGTPHLQAAQQSYEMTFCCPHEGKGGVDDVEDNLSEGSILSSVPLGDNNQPSYQDSKHVAVS